MQEAGSSLQAITEFGVLPLGSQRVHDKLTPHIKALLLYGHHDTGKKLLAHTVAHSTGTPHCATAPCPSTCRHVHNVHCSLFDNHRALKYSCRAGLPARLRARLCARSTNPRVAAGANFFNLSPRNTDGKYPKKAVTTMLHIVFKVARTMAPSVIFIDEVEKVFLSDKKKLKEFNSLEPYNRIKKDLAKARSDCTHRWCAALFSALTEAYRTRCAAVVGCVGWHCGSAAPVCVCVVHNVLTAELDSRVAGGESAEARRARAGDRCHVRAVPVRQEG